MARIRCSQMGTGYPSLPQSNSEENRCRMDITLWAGGYAKDSAQGTAKGTVSNPYKVLYVMELPTACIR